MIELHCNDWLLPWQSAERFYGLSGLSINLSFCDLSMIVTEYAKWFYK